MQLVSVQSTLTASQYDGVTPVSGMSKTNNGQDILIDGLNTFKVKKGDWVVSLPATPAVKLVVIDDEYKIFNSVITNGLPFQVQQYTSGSSGSITNGLNWNPNRGCHELLTSTGTYLVTPGDYVVSIDDKYTQEISSLHYDQEFLIAISPATYAYLFTP